MRLELRSQDLRFRLLDLFHLSGSLVDQIRFGLQNLRHLADLRVGISIALLLDRFANARQRFR